MIKEQGNLNLLKVKVARAANDDDAWGKDAGKARANHVAASLIVTLPTLWSMIKAFIIV
jgi:hypothetical protein